MLRLSFILLHLCGLVYILDYYSWANTAPCVHEWVIFMKCDAHAAAFVHAHTDLVSLGSTKALGTWNPNWSSLSFTSLLKDIRIHEVKVQQLLK